MQPLGGSLAVRWLLFPSLPGHERTVGKVRVK
jgi:hypothetical protein